MPAFLRAQVPANASVAELKAYLEQTLQALEAALSGLVGIEVQRGVKLLTVEGTPEGVITAPVGSLALRTDGGSGTTLYVKESGSGDTGWAAK